jgi:hypothetical protein
LDDAHKTYEKGGNMMDKTISQTGNDGKGLIVALMVLPLLMIGFAAPVYAISKGGAFIGGALAGHVLSGAVNRSERRTRAEESQAYSQQQVARPAAPAPSAAPAAQPSAEQRIQQLDKLAAGGYITPEEYKAKKQSIVNGL